jgi:tetratricopeptide (TPR) repeat protein
MALASLVGYLRTVKHVYTFEEVVSEEKLFRKLDEYQNAKDRTKYLIRKQIAAQSDQLKRLLCALAFFDRPLPFQALEILLPDKEAETIARLVMHNLATMTLGARGTHRYELHAFFSELTRQDEFYDAFLSTLDRSLANLFREKGDAAYQLTYFRRAIDLYDCALAIYHFLDNEGLAEDLARVYANKGAALSRLGQLLAAMAEYDRAIAIIEPLSDREPRTKLANNLATCYINKANAIDELGQSEKAITEYDKAIAIYVRLVFDDRHTELANELARACSNKGVALRHLGQSNEAMDEYGRAITIREWLINHDKRTELASELARVYKNKGVLLDDLRQWKEAIAEYEKAIVIYERLIDQEPSTGLTDDLAKAYMNKAIALAGDSEWSDTLVFYDQAAHLWSELVQQAGRLELLPWWVRVNRLGIIALAKLERWEEVAEKAIDVLSLFTQLMESGQLPNPDAATQEFDSLILTLREWHASDREKIYAAFANQRTFKATSHTAALRRLLA